MKIIIEADDIGKELSLSSLIQALGSLSIGGEGKSEYVSIKTSALDGIKEKFATWKKNKDLYYGETPAGAPVTVVKEKGKRKYTKSPKFLSAMKARAKKKAK